MTILFFLLWLTVGFFLGLIFDSFFEWTIHRYVMHRRLKVFEYPFERHALTHHRVFKADNTCHLTRNEDKKAVPMAWWNGPVLIAVSQIPFAIVAWLINNVAIVCGSLLASCLYYTAYEYLHWCMHIPRKRKVERSGLFFHLNGHHLLHHRYMNKNFNVVLPLADLCFGTLLVRSNLAFAQAGPAVPAVRSKSENGMHESAP